MAKFVPQTEIPVSEQAQIRREKLAALQAEGRDPFQITKFDFNTNSAAIKADYEGFERVSVFSILLHKLSPTSVQHRTRDICASAKA